MIHFVIVGILVIVSTAAIFFGLRSLELLPTQASDQAIIIDNLLDIHWFFIAFFLSLIVVFMLYSLVVFRRKSGELGDGDHFEGNIRLEIIWIIFPLIIVVGMAIVGVDTLEQITRRNPGALEVNVIAEQWGWVFEYPEYELSTTVLALPVDRQVVLKLRSNDVIHSFWVPEFRVKQDVLPGGKEFVRELRITPNLIGEYKLLCAELCGFGHADMRSDVLVLSKPDYLVWIQSQSCQGSEQVCNGKQWATDYGCAACHSFDGTSKIGPTWQGLFGATMPMEGGVSVVADEEFLRESIINPMANIHEGFNPVMPTTFGDILTDQQIEDLVAFIKSLE